MQHMSLYLERRGADNRVTFQTRPGCGLLRTCRTLYISYKHIRLRKIAMYCNTARILTQSSTVFGSNLENVEVHAKIRVTLSQFLLNVSVAEC